MSASLGRAWLHNFDYKVEQAAQAGFQGIEIFYEDLQYVARQLSGSDSPVDVDILEAADHCHNVCRENGLHIIGLQPFLFYEGLKDREQTAKLLIKMKLWLQIVKKLHTDVIQIPANFLPAKQLTEDVDVHVSDLQILADMGAAEEPPVRFAYENLCWSTLFDTWESAWEVVKRVDRLNFGICLDTFNIAGRVWADPTAETGKLSNADADLERSLLKMCEVVDVRKVFYIQIVDAERMTTPLVEGHEFHVDGQPARMSWSRNARTFIYEADRGAYMPVEEVARRIIFGLGYEGYVSMELFSRTMSEDGVHVPKEHAQRAAKAWERFTERLQLR